MSQSSLSKSFLLCVGAPKSGTTWLYDYLKDHPSVDLGMSKEYNILNRRWIKNREFKKSLRWRLVSRLKSLKRSKDHDTLIHKFLNNNEKYFKYFKGLVANDNQIRLTGDITPTYMAIPEVGFRSIRSDILRHGFKPKVVFIMRDPVERCVSEVRHRLRGKSGGRERAWSAADENYSLEENYKDYLFRLRTVYDETIIKLDSVFDKAEVMYLFYEEMFCREKIEELCIFLEIPFKNPDFKRAVNVSRTDHRIDPRLVLEVRSYYDSVYRYVAKKFGVEKVASLWPNASLGKPFAGN